MIQKKASIFAPERFYHGFVLGLIVGLNGRYPITSDRERGFGRYDIWLESFDKSDDTILIEFKVFWATRENMLEDTGLAALSQIEQSR